MAGSESKTLETTHQNSILSPTQHEKPTWRNSLQGLPKYDKTAFGRRKWQRTVTSCANAGVTNVDSESEPEVGKTFKNVETLEPGGVENLLETSINVKQAMAISEDEPSLNEALSGNEQLDWSDTINAELTRMEKVNAWIPVTAPRNTNIIPSRSVFRRKHNNTGDIICYKVRLVIKGFKQQLGVDYVKTFAPTICVPTL